MSETIAQTARRPRRGYLPPIALALAAACALSLAMAFPAYASIPADRSFQVQVRVDGEVLDVVSIWGDDVALVLQRAGVTLGEEDLLSHFTHSPVGPGEFIWIERWVRDTVTVQESIPFPTVQVPTSLIASGRQQPVSEGAPGVRENTYSRLLVDGKVVEQTLESQTVLLAPVSRRVLVGTPGTPLSPFDFEWEMGEDGKPLSYEALLEGQRAAGYTARAGAKTASGRLAQVGHVAVNPKVIPYGSKLFITSADGSFVYGYAIAADTGTSLMQGVIGVDLYYETLQEARLNAIRSVDVYVLSSSS